MRRMANGLMIAGTDTALKRAELIAQGGVVDSIGCLIRSIRSLTRARRNDCTVNDRAT
jgi:hypothetical protein